MKIFGIGTDIINIKRMEKSIIKNGISFKNKIFSPKEIIYCERKKNPSSFYAKRFAAKEALTKALGTGIGRGVNIKNIDVVNDRLGKPCIKLKGNVDKFLKKCIKKNRYNIFLSLSDDEPWAQATVIISYN